MKKRISSRAIIINQDKVYLMFRRRINEEGTIKEYYVIPGGGLNEGESLTDNVIREIKEEFTIDINILGYLGKEETDENIAHFFHCEIANGIPTLGGEELERCTENNYYEVIELLIKDINNYDVMAKEMIMKAFNCEYQEFPNKLVNFKNL